MDLIFDFEKPVYSLETKLSELRQMSKSEGMDLAQEIETLEKKLSLLIDETYGNLSTWQRVQLSRHPNRLYTLDYLEVLFPDFSELHGDRLFGDDRALVAGTAFWPPAPLRNKDTVLKPIVIVGHQKGRGTKQKVERNFGMARPEGYRKVMRVFDLAERFRMPILTFIDTPGAYPGIDAEERGQSQAIAESIRKMFELTVPIASVVIGEGGSGGALAIGVANCVLMQEFSTYSVISPESCASILWSDSTQAERAAEGLKITPEDLKRMGLIDGIIREPKGGCHRNPKDSVLALAQGLYSKFEPWIAKNTLDPQSEEAKAVKELRFKKFREMGLFALDGANQKSSAKQAVVKQEDVRQNPAKKKSSKK